VAPPVVCRHLNGRAYPLWIDCFCSVFKGASVERFERSSLYVGPLNKFFSHHASPFTPHSDFDLPYLCLAPVVYSVPDVAGHKMPVSTRHLFSLEVHFPRQKVASKPLKHALYAMFVCEINNFPRSDQGIGPLASSYRGDCSIAQSLRKMLIRFGSLPQGLSLPADRRAIQSHQLANRSLARAAMPVHQFKRDRAVVGVSRVLPVSCVSVTLK
jgi:hypothetical protein